MPLCDVLWKSVVGVVVGLALMWSGLLVLLLRARPPGDGLREAVRLLPDVLRLVSRLARDRTLPRGVRLRLWLLLGYLALPVDLVPDVIPVIGYADDAVLVVWALRGVARRAGSGALDRHWPGTTSGLASVKRLCGLVQDEGSAPPQTSRVTARRHRGRPPR